MQPFLFRKRRGVHLVGDGIRLMVQTHGAEYLRLVEHDPRLQVNVLGVGIRCLNPLQRLQRLVAVDVAQRPIKFLAFLYIYVLRTSVGLSQGF